MKRTIDPAKTCFVCQACGARSSKWVGRCPDCGGWNQMTEELATVHSSRSGRSRRSAEPVPLQQVSAADLKRYATQLTELDNVLGGGFVPGSMVLIGGDPGIGKSTLLMQAAMRLAAQGIKVLYVSGEESAAQIRLRSDRLGEIPPDLSILCETDVTAVLTAAERFSPGVLIVDSIQTLVHPELASIAGSAGQVRECGAALMSAAKAGTTTVVLVGHVTKEGLLAGPRLLEHLVDTVIYFEGDRQHGLRLLRGVKNRFGSTHEVGLFEMGTQGLTDVSDPSRLFLQEHREGSSGTAVTVGLEGSRPWLLEVQALVAPSHFGIPQRRVSGLDYNRSCLLLAVLERRALLPMGTQDVFLTVTGGLSVTEPAADLAAALAVASSFHDRPLDPQTAFFGELGLSGEVRGVGQPERRLREAAARGFKRLFVPKRNAGVSAPAGMEIIGVEHLTEALQQAGLSRERGRSPMHAR